MEHLEMIEDIIDEVREYIYDPAIYLLDEDEKEEHLRMRLNDLVDTALHEIKP